jgi:hypothetical protein
MKTMWSERHGENNISIILLFKWSEMSTNKIILDYKYCGIILRKRRFAIKVTTEWGTKLVPLIAVIIAKQTFSLQV